MTPQESEVLEQMSSHLADLSIHLSECHADAVKTNVDFMAFPAGQVHALIMDITMFQYRLREIGVPVAAQPLDKVYEGEEYGVKGEGKS
jgi:hypothetical protein